MSLMVYPPRQLDRATNWTVRLAGWEKRNTWPEDRMERAYYLYWRRKRRAARGKS